MTTGGTDMDRLLWQAALAAALGCLVGVGPAPAGDCPGSDCAGSQPGGPTPPTPPRRHPFAFIADALRPNRFPPVPPGATEMPPGFPPVNNDPSSRPVCDFLRGRPLLCW